MYLQYLIAILIAWGFCLLLTIFNLTPKNSAARLDKNETVAVIKHAAWFRIPYPGKTLVINFFLSLTVHKLS